MEPLLLQSASGRHPVPDVSFDYLTDHRLRRAWRSSMRFSGPGVAASESGDEDDPVPPSRLVLLRLEQRT